MIKYNLQTNSPYFPNINILEIIDECFRVASERNTSTAIRELRRNLNHNPI
ncbi:hypothetical protein [Nostoc sp. MS1]|uniref:hypothetical protein n=1 Tax=Nostoc sp. MS1 TaxID=2764711 RepID=UPI001CC5AC9E|nr:hypothetical protein [Nostoc sp. MS1]